ncbi:MAG TPA: hypothetical protein VIH18_11785 [Candidatus Binatia bacterium]|jgi:hypothetical protein
MVDAGPRLFVGIKISPKLQNQLNSPTPGTERYLNASNADCLHVVTVRDEKLIGKYVTDGVSVADIENVSRNICSIVKLITRGRVEENSVCIFVV